VNDDHDLIVDNEFNVTYYNAFRCYYICSFYLADRKFEEAIGFTFKLDKYIKTIEKSYKELLTSKTQISVDVGIFFFGLH
jgi:hypothetical protein